MMEWMLIMFMMNADGSYDVEKIPMSNYDNCDFAMSIVELNVGNQGSAMCIRTGKDE